MWRDHHNRIETTRHVQDFLFAPLIIDFRGPLLTFNQSDGVLPLSSEFVDTEATRPQIEVVCENDLMRHKKDRSVHKQYFLQL